ncbi:MAG: peptidylprolyl isomerase [Bacteroidales bacterium]|nr:peptidylprolyl isomerase [Bacteroidales bacterium]
MRIILSVLILLSTLPNSTLSGQTSGQEVIMTVNGEGVTAEQFLWSFEKNRSMDPDTGIEEYLDLYTDFRLKVAAAKDAGIDKREEFKKELEGYRKQLARNYLTDTSVRDNLLKKAYDRFLEEIRVLHILIAVEPDASPEDTLTAWQKAMNISERIRLGEPFESVARGASDDPNVSYNGGDLGYITVFQTPRNFEDAIYSMSPGQFSRPVRTAAGYHIIKVEARRRSEGRVKVAHIMKAVPPEAPEKQAEEAKKAIDSLYSIATRGEADFRELAKKYSDDTGSAMNGGELPWFGAGEMVPEFAETAFSLLRNGDISAPFRTRFGWHIVKRTGKESPLSFEQAREILGSKLNQSYLLSLSRKSFGNRLRKEYNYRVNNEVVNWLYSIADSSFRSGRHDQQGYDAPGDWVFSFADIRITTGEFLEKATDLASQVTTDDAQEFIDTIIENYSYEQLVNYEDSRLEDKYPEFRYLIKEFHDGMLLFEISDSMVWSRAETDSSGLMNYYESRKEEFTIPESATGIIYSIALESGKRSIRRLTRAIRKGNSDQDIIEAVNRFAVSGTGTLITTTMGTWEKGEKSMVDNVKWTKGYHQFTGDDYHYLVWFSHFNEEEVVPFEQAREKITGDYTKLVAERWMEELRARYDVTVNRNLLNSLRQNIEK